MEKTINLIQYEENIFYLKLLLNNISKSFLVNINIELFTHKIKDDITFIDKTSNILFNHLLDNKKLLTKDEQLHSMLNLKYLVTNTIDLLISKGILTETEYSTILTQNKNDINTIEDMLDKIENSFNKEDLTTNEELNILFGEDDSII